ncbi:MULTISPECIES: helix-turn-helix domain-containing protein [unclassified Gordonia (in: high G+C Gram-positive bacteria)]|uniref:helix-turn-helix domain-containing protein n=1 Tax=unclassified Gordonia (in: high G+C Gram-positive bacteria) TaxID=2657482 RepID=UPI001FFF0EEE|nr:helix-turn-helix domain-containing protein [Gordonia sp. PP30]UQE75270.1 transcriptional regulator [Gordonia sp. PP30]
MADAAMTHIRRAYERLLSGADLPAEAVRSVVRDSWLRSVARGIDPSAADPAPPARDLSADDFEAYRAAHPLTSMRPLVQSLMLDDIADAGVVVALTDHEGRLLWVEGDFSARDSAAAINFVEGAVWSEDTVGTNAPGLALAVDRGVQIRGPEHFASSVQEWNCAAAPVHDPLTGDLLGAIDVTGGSAAAAPFALAAVRSVVAAVERELGSRAVDLAAPAVPRTRGATISRLTVLGAPRWTAADGVTASLSPRHAEILLLLSSHPEGLNTDQLAMLLSDGDLGAVTVRAEISRLRRDLGDLIAARPYRLTVEVESDVDDVRRLLRGGSLVQAVAALGRGGLLAESNAPGVVELFEELREDLRSGILSAADPRALSAWTSSPHGRDDTAAWQRLAAVLPPGHPDRAIAVGRIRLLDRRFGIG